MRYLFGFLLTVQLALSSSWSDPYKLGRGQFERGLYIQAIANYEIALRSAESPRDRAIVLYCLGVAHLRIAQLGVAEQEYKRALDLFRKDGNSVELAVSLGGLGETYRAQYRLDEALAAERHALAILKALGKSESHEAGDVLSITGEILNDQHRLKEAERSMREALAIEEKTLGAEHADVATSLNNLGAIELERKHAAEAEAFFNRALAVRRARYGAEHPAVASTLLSLSAAYLAEKRYAEADETCRRAWETMGRFLPANHPQLTKARIEMALIAHASGDRGAAIGILEESVRRADAQPLADTGAYAELLSLYARYLGEAGEKEKSKQFRVAAEEMAKKSGRAQVASSTVTLTELEGRL